MKTARTKGYLELVWNIIFFSGLGNEPRFSQTISKCLIRRLLTLHSQTFDGILIEEIKTIEKIVFYIIIIDCCCCF